MVLLFIDISTATLTLTEKLVKTVKNVLKTLALYVLFTGLLTLLKITQSFLYSGYRIIQTAAGKISKNARYLYLVKGPKNVKRKKKVLVKTKAINLKM